MADSKPYASLSSGLLARKGGAKPAMRPQGYNGFGTNLGGAGFGGSLEDLGWNDMGPEDEFHSHQGPIGLTPAPRHGHSAEPACEQPAHEERAHEQHSVEEPSVEEAPFEEASFDEAPFDEAPFEEASFEGASFEEAPAEIPAGSSPLARKPHAPPPVVEQQRALRESFSEADVVELPRRRAAPASVKAKAAFTLRLDPERHLKLRLASAVTRLSAQQLVTGALDDFLNSLPELEALAERVPAEAGQRSR